MHARAVALAAVLSLAPPVALAEGPRTVTPPPAESAPAPALLDITGHVRATADGLVLEVAGARLEMRLAADQAEPAPPPAAGGHDFRARFELDGRSTGFVLRFVPPPGAGAAP